VAQVAWTQYVKLDCALTELGLCDRLWRACNDSCFFHGVEVAIASVRNFGFVVIEHSYGLLYSISARH